MKVNLVDYYVDSTMHTYCGKETVEQRKQLIQANVKRLKQIESEIEKKNFIQRRMVSRRSQLHHVLGTTTAAGFRVVMTEEKQQNNRYAAEIGALIYEAYHLTSETLQYLGVIPRVNYVFTYSNGETGYMRAENLTIDPATDLIFETHKNNIIIRLKESAMHQKLAEKNIQTPDAVAKHYQKFAEPFYKAQNDAKNGWRVNAGVVSEAFERHWEKLKHTLESPGVNTEADLGTVAERWILYRQSSGSSPYYTGPDTALSQVKNANASIISNAETVLNTLAAVIKLAESQASASEIANLAAKYQQAFTQKTAEKTTISDKMWDAIDEDSQQFIKEFFGNNLKITKKLT